MPTDAEQLTKLVKQLKDIVKRYSELCGRDATHHEFACCIYSAEDLLAEIAASRLKERSDAH